MTDKEKTSVMLEVIQTYFGNTERNTIIFPELRLGSGYGGISERRVDCFTISPNKGHITTAFEIKASRGDFLRDIRNGIKQRGARMYSNYFYYVAPIGMIKKEEIPIWAGLVEIDIEKARECLKDTHIHFSTARVRKAMRFPVPAPYFEKANPTWGLICAIVRKYQACNGLVVKKDFVQVSDDGKSLERNNFNELLKESSCNNS